MASYELHTSARNVWATVIGFTNEYPDYIASKNIFLFLTDDHGEPFNMGHFWSNFEIADMDFHRDGVYSTFLECINMSCGSFHERWGDASMHYIAVSIV